MAGEVFGFDRDGVRRIGKTVQQVLGRRPDTGRRTRRVYPGGAGPFCGRVLFQLGQYPNQAAHESNAEIIMRPCGCDTVPDEDDGSITVHDDMLCLLLEAGLRGWASYVTDGYGDCHWSIDSLCCPVVNGGDA